MEEYSIKRTETAPSPIQNISDVENTAKGKSNLTRPKAKRKEERVKSAPEGKKEKTLRKRALPRKQVEV